MTLILYVLIGSGGLIKLKPFSLSSDKTCDPNFEKKAFNMIAKPQLCNFSEFY
jgi:hypothetical protein